MLAWAAVYLPVQKKQDAVFIAITSFFSRYLHTNLNHQYPPRLLVRYDLISCLAPSVCTFSHEQTSKKANFLSTAPPRCHWFLRDASWWGMTSPLVLQLHCNLPSLAVIDECFGKPKICVITKIKSQTSCQWTLFASWFLTRPLYLILVDCLTCILSLISSAPLSKIIWCNTNGHMSCF